MLISCLCSLLGIHTDFQVLTSQPQSVQDGLDMRAAQPISIERNQFHADEPLPSACGEVEMQ